MSDNLKPNYSCDKLADGYNVPRDRALVWHAFSDLFLDCSWSEEELAWIGKVLAETKFTIQELSHIVSAEVVPVCFSNTLMLVGSEGALGFSLQWLLENCRDRQSKKPYIPSGNTDEIPLMVHIQSPLYLEA